MDKLVSIVSGKPLLDLDESHRATKSMATIVSGNLFPKSYFKRNATPEQVTKRDQVREYLIGVKSLESPTFLCSGSDDRTHLGRSYKNMENLNVFTRSDAGFNFKEYKFVGISGFFHNSKTTQYHFDEQTIIDTANKEKWCDIFVLGNMEQDGIVMFPRSLYDAVFTLQPKLVILGGLKKTKVCHFPLSEIPCVILGDNDHIVYDMEQKVLFRKIDHAGHKSAF